MRIDIISCQPDLFTNVLQKSIIGRAIEKKYLEINLHNWALDKLYSFRIGLRKISSQQY